jgi:hypothetical protein
MLTLGSLVLSSEHPHSIGEIIRVNEDGALTIQWTTAPSPKLPYGCINTEFWPACDQHLLAEVL